MHGWSQSQESMDKATAGSDALIACWRQEWEVHYRRRHKQRLHRRAILALTLLAEPLQCQWDEVFLDTVFMAWKEVLEERCRSQAQPAAQREHEVAWETDLARQKLISDSERLVFNELHTLHTSRPGILSSECDGVDVSVGKFEAFLQALDHSITQEDARNLVSMLSKGGNRRISIHDVLCWMLDISPQQLASVLRTWEEEHLTWQQEWEKHHNLRMKRDLRRRAVLILGVLAEPLEMQWTEAYCDVIFTAWADYVADDHRTWALPGPRRLFERAAKARAVSSRRTSFQRLAEPPAESISAAMQEAQRTLSRHGSKYLTDKQFEDLAMRVAPRMTSDQVHLLLHIVPRSHAGSIPVDGLVAWIFGETLPSSTADHIRC
jgi:hypothetical protein